jgi:hypothetical protein
MGGDRLSVGPGAGGNNGHRPGLFRLYLPDRILNGVGYPDQFQGLFP